MSAHYPAPFPGESFAYYAHRLMAAHSGAFDAFDLTSAAKHYALAMHGAAAVPSLARDAAADKSFQRFLVGALEGQQPKPKRKRAA